MSLSLFVVCVGQFRLTDRYIQPPYHLVQHKWPFIVCGKIEITYRVSRLDIWWMLYASDFAMAIAVVEYKDR